MTICSLSLLALFVSGIVMYLFREPSEEELKKFNRKLKTEVTGQIWVFKSLINVQY